MKVDIAPLEAYPKSQQVTFKYYLGVIYFLEENYDEVSFLQVHLAALPLANPLQAEKSLTEAWKMCHKDSIRNKECVSPFTYSTSVKYVETSKLTKTCRLILTYLIPCHLLTTHSLPTPFLLAPYPRLQELFSPLARCIKRGDLSGFDAALAAGEDEFVKRRIYLTLERGREIALRNLLRKVFLAGPIEDGVRRSRIPVSEFGAAISIGGKEQMENDEVECLLANMIYKVCAWRRPCRLFSRDQ